MTTGLVLFGHGARDPRWRGTIDALAARLAERQPGLAVHAAFLEFMQPDLAGAVAELVARGVREIVVAPVFLAAGGHVLRDLPDRLAAIAAAHPGLAVTVGPALGSLPTVIDAMAVECVAAVSAARAGGEKGVVAVAATPPSIVNKAVDDQ
jgi:sirohydrochlorin cobaltochelatase